MRGFWELVGGSGVTCGIARIMRGGRRMQRAIIIIALIAGGMRGNAIYFVQRIFGGGF
jgi:hypothetical protein